MKIKGDSASLWGVKGQMNRIWHTKLSAFYLPLSSFNFSYLLISIVLRFELEVSLRMVAYGAHLGSLLAYADVSAVAALPDAVTLA